MSKVGMTGEFAVRTSEVLSRTSQISGAVGNNSEFGVSQVITPDATKDDASAKPVALIDQDTQPLPPFSIKHIGLLFNYFAVGLIYAGGVSALYPVLIVKNFEEPATYTAASKLVTLFWSYKIFFGLISDCFPVFGYNRKPYIILGWVISAVCLILLATQDADTISGNAVTIYLMLSNFGYVMADVAADGYTVWMAHHEPIEIRGRQQSLIYMSREVGRMAINVIVGFALSGPSIMCSNYLYNKNTPCSAPLAANATPPYVFFDSNTVDGPNWCHEPCADATFSFGLTIPQYGWVLAATNIVFIPVYFFLYEEKSVRESFVGKVKEFWEIFQKRAVWQIVLWTINSNILAGVAVNAQQNTLDAWLGLSPIQQSVLNILENVVFFTGLALIRQYFLNVSWRKILVYGTLVPLPFGTLYLLIVFNVWRNSYFYMFTDVSQYFISTLTFLVGVFCVVEISEPGYEAVTYSLVTSAHNMVSPLAGVLSNQISGLFALTGKDIKRDDSEVHMQYFYCWLLCTAINIASLITLPMLPRQKVEARELLKNGGTSKFWAALVGSFALIVLLYSSLANLATLDKTFKCHYWLGGKGCSPTESRAPAIFLICIVFVWVIVTTFLVGYKRGAIPFTNGKCVN